MSPSLPAAAEQTWSAIAGGLATAGLVIVGLIALNAFFSLAETALTAASRARMLSAEKDGDELAARVNRLTSDRERMIGAVLLGSNVATIGASAFAASVFSQTLGEAGPIVSTLVLTPLLLIFGEVLPKTYAITSPDKIARLVAMPIQFLVIALAPLVGSVQWLVNKSLRLLGVRVDEGVDVLAAREEIRGAVELHAGEGSVERKDRDMLRGALDLKDLTVGDVMVHRRSMKTIEVDLPPREIVLQAIQARHTRIPLWKDEPDNIIGILHAKDMFRTLAEAEGDFAALDPAKFTRPVWYVPETTRAEDQLELFLKRRSHFALVVDEYGAIMGLVTLEDIIEEIVGDIKDEHDLVVHGVRPNPDGTVHVDGWVPIRDLNRAMDWALPDDEAVTVAGLVIHEAQTIPEPGQSFAFHGYRFHVLRRQRNAVTALRIVPDPTQGE